MVPTLEWTPEGVRLLDQTRLPLEETYVLATSYQKVADAITTMIVRGAPAIGVTAAMGVALAVSQSTAADVAALKPEFEPHLSGPRRNPPHRGEPLLGHPPHEPIVSPI